MYGPERARARREDYNRTKCSFTNQLARNDIDTLMMLFGFNAGQKDTVRNSCNRGLCLVSVLEGAGQLGEENFSKMMTLLKDRNVPAYNVWNGYKQSWFSDSDTGTMPVVTLQASSAYFTPKTGTKPVTMIEVAFEDMKLELSKVITDQEIVSMQQYFRISESDKLYIKNASLASYQLLSKLERKHNFHSTNIASVYLWFGRSGNNRDALNILAVYQARWISGEEPKSSTSLTYPKMFKVKPVRGWSGRAFADMKEELSKVITDEEIVFMQGSFGMNEIDKRAIKNAHIPSYELLTRLQGRGEGGFHEGNIESVYSFLLERFENTDALRILAAYKARWISAPELSEKIMGENLEPKFPQKFGEFSQTTTNDNAINSNMNDQTTHAILNERMSDVLSTFGSLSHITLNKKDKFRILELHAQDAKKTEEMIDGILVMYDDFLEEVSLAIESEHEENISSKASKAKDRGNILRQKAAAKRRKNASDEAKESRKDKILDRLARDEYKKSTRARNSRKDQGMTEQDDNSSSEDY